MNELLAFLIITLALAAAGSTLWWTAHRRAARRLYRETLESAIADGTLTPEETAELERIRREKALTAAEVRMVARTLYRRAIRDALADDILSPEEDETLARLQAQLGLSDEELGEDVERVARIRLLARVETGDLPAVDPPIPLAPHERCHWVVQASLADLLELPRRSRGEPEGTAFPLKVHKEFPSEGPREELRTDEQILPVDLGMFIVTSRRAIFQGARRTLTVPFARLESVTLFADGLRLAEPAKSAGHYVLLDDAEVTVAILLQAARRRLDELRPTRRSDRTA